MISDTLSSKKLNSAVTQLFIRGTKSFSSFDYTDLFSVLKSIRLNSMHYFIIKTRNKRELEQIAFYNSSNIDFKDLMNLYKKCTAKPHSYFIIDTTLVSDNYSRFRKNLSERIQILTMTIYGKIKDEKLQQDINREPAKVSLLSSGKTDKYEFATGDEILLSDQSKIIKQAKFIYSPFGKAFEKQMETVEDQGIKQCEALKAFKTEENQELEAIQGLFPNKMRNKETKNEKDEIKKL